MGGKPKWLMADGEPKGEERVTIRGRQTVLDRLAERAEPQLGGNAISSNAGRRTPWHHMRAIERTIDSKVVQNRRG